MLGMKEEMPMKEKGKETGSQRRTSKTARKLRGGAMGLRQTGLHFGPQSPAMQMDTLLPALPPGLPR